MSTENSNDAIRVAVAGAAGRMGKTLVEAINQAADLKLGAAFEHPDSQAVGQDVGELSGIGANGVLVTGDVTDVLATECMDCELRLATLIFRPMLFF